jgi:hypothetical protein
MDRLSIAEAKQRYTDGVRPDQMCERFNYRTMREEVRAIIPGMIGAMIQLDLKSISAPEIGFPYPVMVTRYPVLRIFIDPILKTTKKKGQMTGLVSALNYKGVLMTIDTSREYVDSFDCNRLLYSFRKHLAMWESIDYLPQQQATDF